MTCTVHVNGISSATLPKEVEDFFSFCGKISSCTLTPASDEKNAPQSATVTFEKDAAAKTALLLDQTQFRNSVVSVKAAADINELAGHSAQDVDDNADGIAQEDKPRTRILAEYLAYGYEIGDHAIDRAIKLDEKHGFSKRFTSALKDFDEKYNVTGRAKGLDQQHEITAKATRKWQELGQYFKEKGLEHPSGPGHRSQLLEFYQTTIKEICDVHAEARRLANLKQGKTESPGESAAVPSQSESGPETIPAAAPSQPEAATAPAPAAAPVDPKA